MALLHQLGNHRDLMGDVFDRARLEMRTQEIELVAIGVKAVSPVVGEIFQRLSRRLRIADRLVVHIGEIPHVEGGQAGKFETSAKDILEDESTEVSDVGGSIDGRSAAVKSIGLAIARRQFAHLAAHRIKKSHFQQSRMREKGKGRRKARFCKEIEPKSLELGLKEEFLRFIKFALLRLG